MEDSNPSSEALIPQFKLVQVLNQDQTSRRVVIRGKIHDQPALLILEQIPFPDDENYLAQIPSTLQTLKSLGANDIYYWYLASLGASPSNVALENYADLKITLIFPCTEQQIKKYGKQGMRMVEETPQIYLQKVKPYMQQRRAEGRLNWVWNIIDGKTEVEDVIYRTALGQSGEEGFLLLPDLNWDRRTIENLHLLGIVERRDLWSLRDLKKIHVPWLRHMRYKFIEATSKAFPQIEQDLLKLYVHYQPTYYHFHIHVVHVALESGGTQATGKAIGLESIISQLETMDRGAEDGMEAVTLHYAIGEASELWTDIFNPMKSADKASPQQQSSQ